MFTFLLPGLIKNLFLLSSVPSTNWCHHQATSWLQLGRPLPLCLARSPEASGVSRHTLCYPKPGAEVCDLISKAGLLFLSFHFSGGWRKMPLFLNHKGFDVFQMVFYESSPPPGHGQRLIQLLAHVGGGGLVQIWLYLIISYLYTHTHLTYTQPLLQSAQWILQELLHLVVLKVKSKDWQVRALSFTNIPGKDPSMMQWTCHCLSNWEWRALGLILLTYSLF